MSDAVERGNWIKLSPIVRLALTLEGELTLGRDVVFTDHFVSDLRDRLLSTERKRDSAAKALILIDIALVIFMTGGSFHVPLVDLDSSSFPAILESATIFSAFSSIFFSTNFVNWLCYHTFFHQISIMRSRSLNVDPDIITSSLVDSDIFLKIFRRKMNIFGIDLYFPGWQFRVYSIFLHILFFVVLSLIPIAHFSILLFSIMDTVDRYGVSYITSGYTLIVVTMSLVSFLVFAGAMKNFSFQEIIIQSPGESVSQNGEKEDSAP